MKNVFQRLAFLTWVVGLLFAFDGACKQTINSEYNLLPQHVVGYFLVILPFAIMLIQWIFTGSSFFVKMLSR